MVESTDDDLSPALAPASPLVAYASRVGGNIELVDPGETGLLFAPGDAASLAAALATMVHQPEARRSMAAAGAQRIRTGFSREKAAATMAAIYDSFLANCAA